MASSTWSQAVQGSRARIVREHVALDSDGQMLSCFVHRPAEASSELHPAVAVFHGLMGSKSGPHQLYVKLADALASAGMLALRLDFRGRGDSEGLSADVTPERDLADAAKALAFLERQPDVDPRRLALVGHSWGGAIAACLVGRDPRIAAVVTWSSPPGGVLEWKPPMREIDGKQVAELWGNLLGAEFYAGLRHIYPLQEVKKAGKPLLILYGMAEEEVSAADVELTTKALTDAGVPHDVIPIAGADHIYTRYEAEQEVIAVTVAWLQRTLAE